MIDDMDRRAAVPMEREMVTSDRPGTGHRDAGFTGDDDFSWFFRHEFRTVVRTAFVILRDRGRAEDVAQEAFAQLYVHWRKVSRYERPDAWVRRVAIRRALRLLKRERMRRTLERATEPGAVDAATADVDLMREIGSLPPRQRAAVALFYFEDRPTSEIAVILGCSESTAKVHLFKARRHLAAALGEEEDDDDA
jgi:RNA polymerase sigma-70 factor (ECF subfamily)